MKPAGMDVHIYEYNKWAVTSSQKGMVCQLGAFVVGKQLRIVAI
jgi:hypothetical protein